MRLEDQRESTNIEDRRGARGGGGLGGMVGGRRGGIGLGTIVIAIIAAWLFGINPLTVMGLLSGGGAPVMAPAQQAAPAQGAGNTGPLSDEMGRFVSKVLASTEDVWNVQLPKQLGMQYRAPVLQLFDGRTTTACGLGSAASGPFYCPGDQKVYLDTSFYRILKDRMGAPGDTAQAYVIAHEVGHHVQNMLGVMAKTEQMRGRMTEEQNNAISVRVELQADCFAGVWAHFASGKGLFESGDLEEALTAAAAVGDDKLQRESQGYVRPDAFTHGTSRQRMNWFRQGLTTGDMKQCDTFGVRNI
jgi:uncharacterized protein